MKYLNHVLFLGLLLPFSFFVKIVNAQNLAEQVIIRRTNYGVPHIEAENLKAAGYAMGYVQMEDYGSTVTDRMIKARGEWAKYHELKGRRLRNQLDEDATNKLYFEKAVESFHRLNIQTRNLIEGYAQGINKYVSLNKAEFPAWLKPDFSEIDVLAVSIKKHDEIPLKRFIQKQKQKDKGKRTSSQRMTPWANIAWNTKEENPDIGSNAWALAPERTTSGKAILLRNPHLNWDAGYYEAQMKVKGLFDFYGDFRIGQPLGVVGGFNRYLGWATTNNHPDLEEIYALKIDPDQKNRYLLDGTSHPLIKKVVTVAYKKGEKEEETQRTFYYTSYGPVVFRNEQSFFILKSVKDGEYRNDQQYLEMMKAKNLEDWKEAMRMQGLFESNLTYADGDGNIFYVWNAATPILPYQKRDEKGVIHVDSSSQIWTDIYPWNKLPHLLNPKGGYLHNENDPFYYTNMNEVFKEKDFPENFPKPKLDLRSQLSIQLIQGTDKLSLKEVIQRKNTLKMLLADRVKEDLIQAVAATNPKKEMKSALDLIKKWDNTVAKDSRGSILFKLWWYKYIALTNEGHSIDPTPESAGFHADGEALFAQPWTQEDPIHTPYGLADKSRAVKAFHQAVRECKQKYGRIDIPWGEVHRAKLGDQDYAVGGATGALGCFRVLWYARDKKNKKELDVKGGDGWVLAVEFDKTPKAYSVLAYGNSNKKDSPYFADQLKMFVNEKMKIVHYTEQDVKKNTIRTYHPGKE